MKTLLKKPSTLQMTIELIISIFQSIFTRNENAAPQKIEKYTLLTEIAKENHFNDYAAGIYQYKDEKVLIKTWKGKVKSFAYYELINEYLINKLLREKLKSKKISIPKVLCDIESTDSLSVVFEYIDGEKLSSFPLKVQTQAMIEVINALLSVTESLSEEERKILPKRTANFFMYSTIFLVCLTILSNLKSLKVILKAYIEFLFAFKSQGKRDNLYLAHRDLNIHNIMLTNSRVFLVDCGRVALTIKNYDIAYILINSKRKDIYKTVSRCFNYSENKFLTNYILIHQARSFDDQKGFKNIFIKELHKRYG